MTGEKTSKRVFRIGFQTSIITVFVGVVLLVGLTLVYLSFERVTAITRTAASGFIEKVAQLLAPITSTSSSRMSATISTYCPACRRSRRPTSRTIRGSTA
ncbi:hypothetical protein ACVW0J_006154 [Bradyrhizobium sp. i1.7.7]